MITNYLNPVKLYRYIFKNTNAFNIADIVFNDIFITKIYFDWYCGIWMVEYQ